MTRNFTFLLYCACLLLALAYPGQQEPATSTIYTANNKADSVRSIYLPHDQSASNDAISTDPSNEVIGMPEPPSGEGYAPTSIKNFQDADPAEGISMISAPTANYTGNAVLNFNMKLPDGRLGMQPHFTVQYNNEGGSSWLGTGWNLSTPGVGIETRWGAPRYDAALETEMYTLNGEQLAPINNRSALVARVADKSFYTRVEGAFRKIIRHGNNPANYWWEVTEKNGIHHYYGGKPGTGVDAGAVLKDDQGNIAWWALTETRDAGNNFVRYVYETVTDPGIAGGTIPGRQLYLSQVFYTGFGNTDGPYKITFTRDRQLSETRRKDVTVDGRFGFKMVSADLLRKVTISLNNTLIRSYEYTYTEGAFYKPLLTSIRELDDAGNVFYTHRFEYFDDVRTQQVYTPSDSVSTWTIGSDDIKGDIINPIPGFTAGGSALSTSKAESYSAGISVSVGTMAGEVWSKRMTVGGFFSYGEDDEEGLVSMIDINGDALPDKVFKKGSNLFYRANLGISNRRFGESRPINGVNDFSTSNSKNISGGVQAIPLVAFLGYCHTTTTTTTKYYFSDFNGDGLMDIAADGKVLFNHLDTQGNPSFESYSTLTPSPIFTGTINGAFLGIDTALQGKQERDFPLQDIVRFWEAPFDDTVTITAPLQLINIPNQSGIVNKKKDGVRASIQLGDNVLWSTVIDADDHTIKTPVNVSKLHVQKGERIYFRLQSRYNGVDDLVSWDPVIEYTKPMVPSSDVHHKNSQHYQASADFILHNKAPVSIGKDGTITIDGTFKKRITSDSVTLQLTRKRGAVFTTLYERVYAGTQLADGNLALAGQWTVQTDDELYFSVVSRSYIDRSALQWTPHYTYVAFTDNTPVTSADGKPTMQGYPVPDNSNYNNWLIAASPATVAQQDTVTLWPQVSGGGNGTLWFTVKGTDTIYARRRIWITNGNMNTAMDSIHLVRKANEPLYMEFVTDTLDFAMGLQAPAVEVYRDSIFLNAGVPDTTTLLDTLRANLYTNPAQEFLGPLFRGWGHFALKGDIGDVPIDRSKLNLDELNGYPTDPNLYQDPASMGNLPNPSKTSFIVLFPDPLKQSWIGYDTSVYVASGMMSSSRLWMHDVSVDSLMAGESAGAAHKVSNTVIESFAAGAAVSFGDVSYGNSTAMTTTRLDMMDMNGDRYPDVLNDDMIQYTLPNGGLGSTVIQQPVGPTLNRGQSEGLSGGGEHQRASTKNKTSNASVSAQKTAKASPGMSGSINSNDDESLRSWVDMNGDGLTDRVYEDGSVSLNLGYRFAPAEQWGFGGIDRSSSTSVGAGLGVSLSAGSYQAGFGLSSTTGNNTFLLNDVNGDGLPDQTAMSGGVMVVRLNTGNGFGPEIAWNAFDAITTNVSTGESFNSAFTATIPIFIIFMKICINPSANIGHGVSRQEKMVMDIDGDGYADMLQSENDGHLKASVSSIGRTNMLRKVNGPMGGAYFSMDYERVGNTYDLPQSKWVLKSVEIFDGVPGDGIDTMRQQFSYEDGFQDRQEREFYGFKKVISRDLNTANNNIVYRSHVQQFLNSTYYNKGLLVSEWLEDAAGKRFTQTNNLYDLRALQTYVQYPALHQTERLFYEGAATAGVRTVTQYEYDALGNVIHISDAGDGSQQDMILTDITYHDLDALYIKTVPASIEVTTAEGLKRKRTTAINTKGDITRIRQFLADGRSADTDMEYDSYGNMTKLTRPANYKGERMWYSYEYDNVIHNYITRVTDAFGYTSSSTWDYRFGALTSTLSRNNEPMQYQLDNRGRLIMLTGPYELAAGKPYTIAFDYNATAVVPYALTRHHDPEYNADIKIVNFSDGLGRNIQTKKQVSLFKGKDVADELKMVVSGTVLFDAFGRGEQNYYPIMEPMGSDLLIINPGLGNFTSAITYDVLDREAKTVLADGATSSTAYGTVNGLFSTLVTDALNNRTETQSDVRDRKRFFKAYGPDGIITTRYDYNALSELLKVLDHKGNAFTATYDNLGRKLSTQHPDAGRTDLEYDLAGNLLKKINARIRKEIPNGGAIQYQYEYERLTDIDYPRHYQNKVKYSYGKAGTGSKAGRLVLQQDATGGQEFFYGKQGEVIKVIRTVLTSPVFATTYVSEQEYDTWNRLKKMTYPDGEQVSYHYNKGGGLYSMNGFKQGNTYKYVDQLGYDEFEERVYLRYGNGAATRYTYDSLRRRLTQLQAITPAGRSVMNNNFSYDAVSNVLGMVNNVQAQTVGLGGYAKHQYHYDNLYRIDSASGEYQGAKKASGYSMKLTYDNLYNIVQKKMHGATEATSYDEQYVYDGPAPHQATQAGHRHYRYDENGNQLGYGDLENFWDEENRLIAVLNKGVLSQYTYDAGGNRTVSSSGGVQGIWVNGAPAGAVLHNDNYTVDVSPYISCKRASFTKHYYIESQRIATKLGHGNFTNISFPQSGLTAGGVDYTKRAAQIEKSRLEYYASLGVSPGPPTDKLFWARPENSGIAASVITDSTATQVPRGWPGNTTPPPNGPPVFVNPIPSNDSVKAGYGFQEPGHLYESSQHFYHPDQWGSTYYVTNTLGEISQHIEYSPFGETFVEEHTGSWTTPYLFNGKSRDAATGYYYYGVQYYDPVLSQWLSVADPTGAQYPGTGNGGYGLLTGMTGGNYSAAGNGINETVTAMISGGAGGEGPGTIDAGGDESKKDKSKKGGGNKQLAGVTKGSAPKQSAQSPNRNNVQKKAFRQQRNAMQGNGMFFGHAIRVERQDSRMSNRASQR